MDSEQKELQIYSVEKYNKISKFANGTIVLKTILIAAVPIYFYSRSIDSDVEFGQMLLDNIYLAIPAWSVNIMGIVGTLSVKYRIKIEIERIKKFFASHGLVLKDEIAKARSK